MKSQTSGAISATERCTICERRPAATLLHAATPVLHLGADEFLTRLDPNGCEADLQLQSETPEEATADVVARTLAHLG